MHRRNRSLYCIVLAAALSSPSALPHKNKETLDLRAAAVQMRSSNPSSRQKIKKELRTNPQLYAILNRELQSPRYPYALEIIYGLRLKEEFLTPLIERSRSDADGFVILTLNTWIDDQKIQKTLTREYTRRLSLLSRQKEIPIPAVMAMIEGLTLMNSPLEKKTLEALLEKQSPEVSETLVEHLRELLLNVRPPLSFPPGYFALLKKASTAPYQQVRAKSASALVELEGSQRNKK